MLFGRGGGRGAATQRGWQPACCAGASSSAWGSVSASGVQRRLPVWHSQPTADDSWRRTHNRPMRTIVDPTTPAVVPAGWSVGRWPLVVDQLVGQAGLRLVAIHDVTRRPADRRGQAADRMPLEMIGQRPAVRFAAARRVSW